MGFESMHLCAWVFLLITKAREEIHSNETNILLKVSKRNNNLEKRGTFGCPGIRLDAALHHMMEQDELVPYQSS